MHQLTYIAQNQSKLDIYKTNLFERKASLKSCFFQKIKTEIMLKLITIYEAITFCFIHGTDIGEQKNWAEASTDLRI